MANVQIDCSSCMLVLFAEYNRAMAGRAGAVEAVVSTMRAHATTNVNVFVMASAVLGAVCFDIGTC